MPDPLHLVPPGELAKSKVSRRRFMAGSGAALASTGLAAVAVATHPDAAVLAQDATPAAATEMDHASVADAVTFFNPIQAAMVVAITARIMPGDANDPGAREASVVNFIDRALAGPNLGVERKTYQSGPFLRVSEEPNSVEATSAPDIYRSVTVNSENASRYGFQSIMTPQDMYTRGLEFINAYAQTTFELDFVDLSEDQQDQVLTAMDGGEDMGFSGPTAKGFFTQLRNDTIEGFFSDPLYGGNQGMAGWALIGYPGAQFFYLPTDLTNQEFSREPQSLAQLVEAGGH